jgi:isopenicillin N synthase-like dioxygenase
VPVIDFGPFLDGTAVEKTQIGCAIREASEGTGFFYLARHGVPQAQVEAIFAASRFRRKNG